MKSTIQSSSVPPVCDTLTIKYRRHQPIKSFLRQTYKTTFRLTNIMAIKTPQILPGEKGYVPKKERTAKKKEAEKRTKAVQRKKDKVIGKIKTGGKGYRIGKISISPRKEKKYPIWRYSKKIGEIIVSQEDEIELTFKRLGGIGNFKHLIQDADFQLRWAIREQELLMTQEKCFTCSKKISKAAKPNLYHHKMFKMRTDLLEKASKVPEQVISGKLTIEKGWEKFNDLLESGNRYYMSLKDTVLLCAACAKQKNLNE